METDEVLDEPAVDRWQGSGPPPAERAEGPAELPFFRLSGGLMKSAAKTSNRIDGLLMRMMEHPSSGSYRSNVDGNLDYLFTSLQLDMIGMVASDYSEPREETREEDLVHGPEEALTPDAQTSAPLVSKTEK